ncbi:LuxR C-terminal-related transcriptional regulator [Flammeovirga kamogawensis]|uniref:HTH luxR-type domain-containing protein n=1 Tax=Flammeovirga kamogawensis TaxID=373891 RepID=A0ABX8H091_9BACT|nr:LuxR C-terminal-related transcriptional regulator [Flammeovirga kamogawensis]MBB6462301.1 DNA-binding CsgD family transcriptional regulator [Flammeovirga kamogawensis]QWG09309.1 hypothetical protein KM029_22140 [Flammeovirga kamogawensis]TRX64831.1 hypothetical protein EO216_20050 [Flammeovirga kamogawensis]
MKYLIIILTCLPNLLFSADLTFTQLKDSINVLLENNKLHEIIALNEQYLEKATDNDEMVLCHTYIALIALLRKKNDDKFIKHLNEVEKLYPLLDDKSQRIKYASIVNASNIDYYLFKGDINQVFKYGDKLQALFPDIETTPLDIKLELIDINFFQRKFLKVKSYNSSIKDPRMLRGGIKKYLLLNYFENNTLDNLDSINNDEQAQKYVHGYAAYKNGAYLKAIQYLEEYNNVFLKELSELDSTNRDKFDTYRELAENHYLIGKCQIDLGNKLKAKKEFDEALIYLEKNDEITQCNNKISESLILTELCLIETDIDIINKHIDDARILLSPFPKNYFNIEYENIYLDYLQALVNEDYNGVVNTKERFLNYKNDSTYIKAWTEQTILFRPTMDELDILIRELEVKLLTDRYRNSTIIFLTIIGFFILLIVAVILYIKKNTNTPNNLKNNNKLTEELSKQEKEMLDLVIKGLPYKAIADQLDSNEGYIKMKFKKLREKYQCSNNEELIYLIFFKR